MKYTVVSRILHEMVNGTPYYLIELWSEEYPKLQNVSQDVIKLMRSVDEGSKMPVSSIHELLLVKG